MRSFHRIGLALAAFAITLWLPTGGFAELAKWDQERVTALSAELAKACDALYDTFVKEPESTIGSGRPRDLAAGLHLELRAGEGRSGR